MQKQYNRLNFFALATIILYATTSVAGIQFAGRGAAIALNSSSAQFEIAAGPSINGWPQESIVRSDETVLASGIKTNATLAPNMLINNSNTLLYLNRTTSNALLFGIKNNSNTILALKQAPTFSGSSGIFSNNQNLSPTNQLVVANDLTLDGGGNKISFAQPGVPMLIVSPGKTLELSNVLVDNFSFDGIQTPTNSTLIFADKTKLVLGSTNNDLSTTYTFVGECILDGNGKTINLSESGARFVIMPHSSLMLENITVKGLSANAIQAMDSTSTLTLRNTALFMDADFSYTSGAINILGSCDINGTSTFNFQTNQSLIILDNATLRINDGVTFFYNPPTDNRDLFAFQSNAAACVLTNATFLSSSTGMRLTKGMLNVFGIVTMTQYGYSITADSEGFAFGNNNSLDDLTVTIGPSSELSITNGRFIYDQTT